MAEILDKLNIVPTNDKGNDVWYLSPFRNEKTASFHVSRKKNKWYDFGERVGGDVVGFVCKYLEFCGEPHSVSDALRLLRKMWGSQAISLTLPQRKTPTEEAEEAEPALRLKKVEPLTKMGLGNYLEKRGIPLDVAKRHLFQIRVHNKKTDKCFRTLGFKNEDDGWELRNPFFKGVLGPKTITAIPREQNTKLEAIHIFEGFLDLLSAIAQMKGKGFKHDVIVLNSIACIPKALPYIQGYGYKVIYTWMDNDDAGSKATEIFAEFAKTEEGLLHKPMNDLYKPHKDVNEWWMAKQGLKELAND
ncbi:toprim domain-containing protein [Hufsiella ginkgonis]|nr:toprim domain-containing protein [Hufsiella ginkgonis]